MHLRPAFAETDLDRMAALITAHSFGLLVTAGFAASHVPMVVAREGDTLVIEGHLAAANPQCAAIAAGGEALAVFAGPHAYISPGWYATQPAVPTWDYAAVHLHGRMEPLADCVPMLKALARHDPNGFEIDALPAAFRTTMLGGITGFRLRAERIEAQWKMSQNRSVADRRGVIAALQAQAGQAQGGQDRGRQDVAALIAATLPPE